MIEPQSVSEIAARVAEEHGLSVGDEVTHAELVPGNRYWMSWSCYWQRVEILRLEDRSLGFRTLSGFVHGVATVPSAHFFPIL